MNRSVSVLIVDHDTCVREFLRAHTQGHGWAVANAESGSQMRARIEVELRDVVLLALRQHGEEGLALARHLRARHGVGIIMVAASGDVIERAIGLEIGADYDVAKPFELRERLAHVKSVLRRLQARPETADEAPALAGTAAVAVRQRIGHCELDLQSRRMFDSGGPEVTVIAMAFELLQVFLANPKRALSRVTLLMHTRNREWEPDDRAIVTRIGRLRRKVEPEPAGEPRCRRAVRNVGYRFVPAN